MLHMEGCGPCRLAQTARSNSVDDRGGPRPQRGGLVENQHRAGQWLGGEAERGEQDRGEEGGCRRTQPPWAPARSRIGGQSLRRRCDVFSVHFLVLVESARLSITLLAS